MNKYFDVNSEGHSIRCKMYYNEIRDIEAVVLCTHGFGGHKDNKATERFAETVLSKYKKVAVLTFDLPAHGKDVKKKWGLKECDEYITILVNYIKNDIKASRVFAYGNSFGAYLFLKYISEHENPFEKVALRSPALDIYESMTSTIMEPADIEKLEKGKDALVGFDSKVIVSPLFLTELQEADVRKIDYLEECEKLLIFQGTKDEIINAEGVKKFADDNLIELIMVEGADHRIQNPAAMGNVIRDVIAFFEL